MHLQFTLYNNMKKKFVKKILNKNKILIKNYDINHRHIVMFVCV